MGLCVSCTSTSVATAKLILQDGRLQEFSYPVKVSYIISKDPNIFICNSDEMEFDDVVSAIREDEELQPGELYFALPLSKLSKPLQAEEMAALAVKANAALLKSAGGEKCGCRKTTGFFGGGEKEKQSPSSKVADLGSANVSRVRRGNRSGNTNRSNGRKKLFLANLSAIPE